MEKDASKMTLDELAQAMSKSDDSLDRRTAQAEIMRRQTQAQLDACAAQIDAARAERESAFSAAALARATEKNAKYLLASGIVAAGAAIAAAVAAYFTYHAAINMMPY
jgi:hypothetical protein